MILTKCFQCGKLMNEEEYAHPIIVTEDGLLTTKNICHGCFNNSNLLLEDINGSIKTEGKIRG